MTCNLKTLKAVALTMNNTAAVAEQKLMSADFSEFSTRYKTRTETLIKNTIASDTRDKTLNEAMCYGLLGGGKRVRALLAFAAAEAVGKPTPMTDTCAVALECIHAYSLIHDDLPAMDDDELRRGKPTCHIAFDEATAILAGDALQTAAFEILSQAHAGTAPNTQLTMIATLARASGQLGMVAGQAIDLGAVDRTLSLDELITMHSLKTGALIQASVALGALSTGAASESQLDSLKQYADAIGLAFQIQDDILDVTSDTQTLGKQQGADIALNKPTFVSLLGLKGAQEKAQLLYQQALHALSPFGDKALRLEQLAHYIIQRRH